MQSRRVYKAVNYGCSHLCKAAEDSLNQLEIMPCNTAGKMRQHFASK